MLPWGDRCLRLRLPEMLARPAVSTWCRSSIASGSIARWFEVERVAPRPKAAHRAVHAPGPGLSGGGRQRTGGARAGRRGSARFESTPADGSERELVTALK